MELLRDVKVLSFNHYLMGPVGAQHLADLGADVIAIEPLDGAFQRRSAIGGAFVGEFSAGFLSTGRNKRSIALNLKSAGGLAVALALVKTADVLMENYRPGTMGRLGLGYEDLRALNPRLIYASASGYGATGPYRDRPGQDLLLQSLSGLANVTGTADGPPVAAGAAIIDHHGGALYALGILAALYDRTRTGTGRLVEVSLMTAALDLQAEALTGYMNGATAGYPRAPGGLASWYATPPYGIYATADGHLTLSMGSLADFGRALDLPALATISEAEALARQHDIVELIAARLVTRSTADWTERFTAAGLWFAAVNDYDAVTADPQIRHVGAIGETELGDGNVARLVQNPIRYDGASPPTRLAPQRLGAQTAEILGELGYTPDAIAALVREGSIGVAAAPGPEGRLQ